MRGAGAETLGRIGTAADLGALLALVEDPHPWPRRGAIYALGRLGLAEAAPRIREELRNPSAEVRLAAIWAIGQLRDDGAIEGLVRLLRATAPAPGRPPPEPAGSRAVEPPEDPTAGEVAGEEARARQFDSLVQALGRLAERTADPLIQRALLEARARVGEAEGEREARLPPPERERPGGPPSLRRLLEAALVGAAEEEGGEI